MLNAELPKVNIETTYYYPEVGKPIRDTVVLMTGKVEVLDWLFQVSRRDYLDANDLYDIFPSTTDMEGRTKMSIFTSKLEDAVNAGKSSYADIGFYNLCGDVARLYELDLYSGGFVLDIPMMGPFMVIYQKERYSSATTPIFISLTKKVEPSVMLRDLENLFNLHKEGRIASPKQTTDYYQWVPGEAVFGVGWQKKDPVSV